MRIVEPKKYSHPPEEKKQKRNPKNRRIALLLSFLIVLAGVFIYLQREDDQIFIANEAQSENNTQIEVEIESPSQKTGLVVFSGNEFRVFYDNLLQPNLDRVDLPPTITGNDIADARIREIAETRGYRLRSNPTLALPSVQGYRLQESVHQPWLDLQAAAATEGLQMSVVSAYRSVDTQRSLFLTRLNAKGVTTSEVANGTADAEVDEVLITSSIPGYSKHHTGYTIDIQCAGFSFENFKNSPCNDWINANNYEKAKTYGFIPSYPPDADMQGPDPEAWEYVYVGADLLTN